MTFNILEAVSNKDFIDYLRTFGIYLHLVNMHPRLRAFVYYSRRSCYHVFINTSLSLESQRFLVLHELKHILDDMPRFSYIIGVDMQCEYFEKNAEFFAGKIAAKICR